MRSEKLPFFLLRPVIHRIPRSFLAQYNLPLLVNLLLRQQQVRSKVPEKRQRARDRLGARVGEFHLILRPVETAERVRVSTKAHPHLLEPLDESAGSKMRAAVKRQVLE